MRRYQTTTAFTSEQPLVITAIVHAKIWIISILPQNNATFS